MVGIGGLMGAGRTELLRAVFGLDPVRRGDDPGGRLERAGHAAPPPRAGRRPAERGPQGRGPGAVDVAGRQRDALAAGRHGPGWLVLPSRQRAAAARWIERLRIRCRGGRQPVGELSGGNQQKVALARLLHHDVDVFLLDEPTRGIDVGSKAEIYALIDELAPRGQGHPHRRRATCPNCSASATAWPSCTAGASARHGRRPS